MKKSAEKFTLNVTVANYICQIIIDNKRLSEEFYSEYHCTLKAKHPKFTIFIITTHKKNHNITYLKRNSAFLYFSPNKHDHRRSLFYRTEAAIAVLTLRKNILFLHASSFKIKDKVFIFCGPSGAGKSTILKLAKVYPSLSDDTTIIRKEGSKYFVYPSPFDKIKVKKRLKNKVSLGRIFIIKKAHRTHIISLSVFEAIKLFIKKSLLLSVKNGQTIYIGTQENKQNLLRLCLSLLVKINIDKLYFTKTADFLKSIESKY